MNERVEYRFSFFTRLFFIFIGLFIFFIGFFIDGIKFLGVTTTNASFNPIKVSIYKSMMDINQRYRWKIKYEFTLDGNKYIGSKFQRGGPDHINFKKEVGYFPLYPKINWLESDSQIGVLFAVYIVIGQFFIWLAFRKKVLYENTYGITINGVYYSNSSVLPVVGLNTKEYLRFLIEVLKTGFSRVLSFKVFFVLFYLFIIWYFVIWAKSFPDYEYLTTLLSTFTYAQAGFHGNALDMLGGFIGKTLLLCFLIHPIIETQISTNYTIGDSTKTGNISELFSNIGSFIIGYGISIIMYLFFTCNACREDSIIGFILFLYCLKSQKNLNNPIIGFINSFVNGKPQNKNAAKNTLLGASIGFLSAFIINWTAFVNYIQFSYSLFIIVFGIVLLVISSFIKADKASEVSL